MRITPPDAAAINGWVALLTPVAIAVLTVVQVVAMRMGITRGVQAAKSTNDVKDVLGGKTDEVKTAVDAGNKEQNKKLDGIHRLVNSEYGAALAMAAAALERIARMTGKKSDKMKAAAARRLSADHDSKQAAPLPEEQ